MERNANLGSPEHYGLATNVLRHVPLVGPIVANLGRGFRNAFTDVLGSKNIASVVDTIV